MKIYIITPLLLFVIIAAESAQPSKRSDKNSNLAVMLAYNPKSEIRTKDENDKSWNYRITGDKSASSEEELNTRLMDLLTKEKLVKYFSDITDRESKNNKRSTASSCSLSSESDEFIDDAKIVKINKEDEDKKSCYKNTYRNVLHAFEEALKSQIQDYKKCVCQRKQKTSTTTTTTTSTTTTEAPEPESSEESYGVAGRASNNDVDVNDIRILSNDEIALAADHPEDLICFHKQYAIMLKKLLDQIPCKAPQPSDIEKFNNEAGNKRSERHNVQSNESESIELDVSKITQKPTVKENIKMNEEKIDMEEDELKELILSIVKEHLKLKRNNEEKGEKVKMTTSIILDESVEDVDNQDKFVEKLKKLFQELESQEESFPVRSKKSNDESTTSVSSRKPTKKSIFEYSDEIKKSKQNNAKKILTNEIPRRSTVSEDSDESSENSIKLKNVKLEKQFNKTKENLREQLKSPSSTTNNDKYRKSYRTAVRADKERNHYSLDEHATKKETTKVTKNSSSSNDDRIANDLAKAISDLARKYIKS